MRAAPVGAIRGSENAVVLYFAAPRHLGIFPATEQRSTVSKALRLLSLVLLILSVGCAGHSSRTLMARQALDRDNPEQARALLNDALNVKSADQQPDKDKGRTALLLLDRSVVSLALDDHEASSADLEYADKKIEMLDMSRTAAADVGKFLFTDSAGPYKAPPYEKVMVNSMNLQNYLARHQLNGARIEARRFSIISDYLAEHKNPALELNAVGSYLAGFAFEKSGRSDIALRYYDEALQHYEFESLREPVRRLSHRGSYSTPRLEKIIAVGGATAASSREGQLDAAGTPAAADKRPAPRSEVAQSETDTQQPTEFGSETTEVLVIVNYGRIPAKEAQRLPIGLALTMASDDLSPDSRRRANELAVQGLLTWVNFPTLEKKERPIKAPTVSLDGQALPLEEAGALDRAARKVYEAELGKIITSAITRMITRTLVGAGTAASVRAASDNGMLGFVAGAVATATMTAADTPDTRSWATLPARIAFARRQIEPGEHRLVFVVQGRTIEKSVTVQSGDWQVIVVSVLR